MRCSFLVGKRGHFANRLEARVEQTRVNAKGFLPKRKVSVIVNFRQIFGSSLP